MVVVLVCAGYAAYVAVWCCYHEAGRISELKIRYQYECPMHLIDLYDYIIASARQHDRFPEDLTFITKKWPIGQRNARMRLSLVLCPGSQTPIDLERVTPDYAYVNWSAKLFAHVVDVPGEYPLVYDRTLSNHSGRGVFVLRVNGSVIWDPGAEWVRGFSGRHPEYHVLIPQ
jgi:hypothetical protein